MKNKEKRVYYQDRELDELHLEAIKKNSKGNIMKHDFAIRLNNLLRQNSMTQEALANKTKDIARKHKSNASISTASISDYIKGKALPNSEKVILMAIALNVTCDELLRGIKTENLSVHEKTGLKDEAIQAIINIKNNEFSSKIKRIPALNSLLEYTHFPGLLWRIEQFIEVVELAGTLNDLKIDDMLVGAKTKEIETLQKSLSERSGVPEDSISDINDEDILLFKLQQDFVTSIKDIASYNWRD